MIVAVRETLSESRHPNEVPEHQVKWDRGSTRVLYIPLKNIYLTCIGFFKEKIYITLVLLKSVNLP
jgi:hypothetical protein